MKVYQLLPTDDFELCRPDDSESFNKATSRASSKIAWQPFSVRIVHWNQGKKLGRSDAPWWGSHVLILRKEASTRLADYLADYGELLPLDCEETPLVAFRATQEIEGLSPASSVERFDDGSISMVWKYVFEPSAVTGRDVFKVRDLGVSPLFVGDRFVAKWRASGLVGLEFDELWRS